MPSNNKKSNSRSSSKQDYTMVAFLGLVVVLFGAYYLISKHNREVNTIDSFDNEQPNLKASSGEVIVALFYADWCPHCVSFKPDYKKAMSELNGNEYKGKTLRFVMVDCEKYKSLAKKYDVNGFPTVKILNDDGSNEEYDGERTFEGLSSYFA